MTWRVLGFLLGWLFGIRQGRRECQNHIELDEGSFEEQVEDMRR